MIERIKKYLEYRRNKKIAKRELAKMAAVVLPAVRAVSDKGAEIVQFVVKLTNETKNVNGEKLIEMVLSETAGALQVDNSRIMEVLTYMVNLKPEDIQKILDHSLDESIGENVNTIM